MLGKQLGMHYAVPFLDLDNVIEQEEKCTINDIFSKRGKISSGD